MWVQSLTSFSGLRIQRCHELWFGSCFAVAVVYTGSCSSDSVPSQGASICRNSNNNNNNNNNNKKKKKKKEKKERKKKTFSHGVPSKTLVLVSLG